MILNFITPLKSDVVLTRCFICNVLSVNLHNIFLFFDIIKRYFKDLMNIFLFIAAPLYTGSFTQLYTGKNCLWRLVSVYNLVINCIFVEYRNICPFLISVTSFKIWIYMYKNNVSHAWCSNIGASYYTWKTKRARSFELKRELRGSALSLWQSVMISKKFTCHCHRLFILSMFSLNPNYLARCRK